MIRVPDARFLPPGMVLLPDGHRLPAAEFFRLHGRDLAHFPDAQIAVSVPAFRPSQEFRDAIKGTVGALAAVLAAALIRNSNAARIVGGFASGYIGADVADWCSRSISTGASVRIITPRQIMRGY